MENYFLCSKEDYDAFDGIIGDIYGRATTPFLLVKSVQVTDSFRFGVRDILVKIYQELAPKLKSHTYEFPSYIGVSHEDRYLDVKKRLETDVELKEICAIFKSHPLTADFDSATNISDYIIDNVDLSLFTDAGLTKLSGGFFFHIRDSISQDFYQSCIINQLFAGKRHIVLTAEDLPPVDDLSFTEFLSDKVGSDKWRDLIAIVEKEGCDETIDQPILLSATPIRNDPRELAELIKLLVPVE